MRSRHHVSPDHCLKQQPGYAGLCAGGLKGSINQHISHAGVSLQVLKHHRISAARD